MLGIVSNFTSHLIAGQFSSDPYGPLLHNLEVYFYFSRAVIQIVVSRWIPHAGKDVWGILEEVNFSTSRAMCVNAGPGERSRDTHTHWPDRVHWSGRGLTLDLSRRDRPRSWESEFKSQPEPWHHDNPEVRVLNLTLEELQTDQRFPSGLAHYPSP